MTDVLEEEARPQLLAALFAGIAVLMLADVGDDMRAGAGWLHLAVESLIVVLAAAGVVALWGQLRAVRSAAQRLGQDLTSARADATRWRAEAQDALRGLATAIDRQLERWELTAAERAVAVLLLKGLSHKEVANERNTSERTVRQQALAIYRKARVHSRAELSAFFLHDLPMPAAPVPGA